MALFPTRPFTSTATGTGTAETADVTFTVPSNAVEIAFVRGHVHATNGDPAESIFGVFKLKGQDFKYNPYEWFGEIGPSKLGAIDETGYAIEPRWWTADVPVVAGSTIACSYEPVDALAQNGQFMIDVMWSTKKLGRPITQRLCSRETGTGTSTGPSLTISNAARITEFTVGCTSSTVAADDPSNGKLQVTSGALLEQQTMELGFNLHTIEATSGVENTTLFYADVDIPVKNDPAVFTSTFTADTVLGTAGQYAYSIGYVLK